MTGRRRRIGIATRLPIAAAGGIESAVRELAPRIAARRPGWELVLVHAFPQANRWNRVPLLGDIVAALVLAARTRACDAVVMNGAEYAWPRVLRKHERERTLVVWHGTRAGEIPALVPRMSVSVRTYRLLEIWLQRAALRAKRQIAVSEKTAAELDAVYRRREKVTIVPNGAPSGALGSRESPGGHRVAWIGTNPYKKGLDIALAACEEARKTIPNLELNVIGIERSSAAWPAQPWARYLGRIDHARSMDVLARSSVLLATSRYEGCSVAIVEALALGIPIVAGPSVAWMVGDGGVAVGSFSYERYAEALQDILSSPQRLLALARGARLQAQKFDWDAAADAYVTEIEACLAEA